MSQYRIPFNKPTIAGNEIEYILKSVHEGHISGDGPFTKQCHQLLQSTLGVPKALLTTSCTHALEMAALLLNIQPGDEVIVPSFTFVSTINAFVLRGARPVFIDIRPDTLNLNEQLLERLVTKRTRAILPVHYAGVGCEMDMICAIGEKYNIPIVEDNAHGLYGKYRGKWLGTFGVMSTLSFHETKNFYCGEGGALIINNEKYIEQAEILREKGTNRSRFFRGQVDKYTWVSVGSSYLPSDLLAAFLLAQLESRDQIQMKRGEIWEFYRYHLQDWADENKVRLPIIPSHCEQSYHMFYMIMPSLAARESLIARLKEKGILAVFHYLPLHLSEMGKRYDGQTGDCPVCEDLSDRLVRLPFYNSLTEGEQAEVIDVIKEETYQAKSEAVPAL
jgi:dTDP-4-amino-4,6-dideoxygalactose transaminase